VVRITALGITKFIAAASLAASVVACGTSSDGSADADKSPPSAAASADGSTAQAMTGCDIKRPDSVTDEGGPFTDLKADVLMPCGWPDDQVGVMGKNATYWLSPFNGTKLVPEGTCMFWVYNARHTTSYVSPTILSKSKVTIRASYMGPDGRNKGFAPGSVTVDDIYQVTPKFVLSLRDNKSIDLSKCGKTTPVS
jgi:hypothetical protein